MACERPTYPGSMTDPLVRDTYTAPSAAETPARPARSRRASTLLSQGLPSRLGLSLLLGLGVLALLVIFALPVWVNTPAPAGVPGAAAESGPEPERRAAQDSKLMPEPAGARESAQEALVALMEDLDALRAQRVTDWDATGLAAIEALQAKGEEAYRAHRYSAAQREYQAARLRIEGVSAQLPAIIEELIDEGERALRGGDAGAAERAFTRALALSPKNVKARLGQQRAQNRDRVVALLGEAQGYESMGESQQAERAWRAALALDPQAAEASQGLARLARARADLAFADRMSEGYAALEKGQFQRARSAFEAALKLQPQAPEAANALAQTTARATAAQLEDALVGAARAARAEDWTGAEQRYREALAVDPGVPAAQAGASSARQRAALDHRLETRLREPVRLAEPDVQRETEALLREARAVGSPGPRLQQQITALQTALTAARMRVPVVLSSDGLTEVMLVGHGRLGQFLRREIPLSPGRYTAVGSRPGFRDARVAFTVEATGGPPIIEIQCLEALPFGR